MDGGLKSNLRNAGLSYFLGMVYNIYKIDTFGCKTRL